jgi:hypothetical protein
MDSSGPKHMNLKVSFQNTVEFHYNLNLQQW